MILGYFPQKIKKKKEKKKEKSNSLSRPG